MPESPLSELQNYYGEIKRETDQRPASSADFVDSRGSGLPSGSSPSRSTTSCRTVWTPDRASNASRTRLPTDPATFMTIAYPTRLFSPSLLFRTGAPHPLLNMHHMQSRETSLCLPFIPVVQSISPCSPFRSNHSILAAAEAGTIGISACSPPGNSPRLARSDTPESAVLLPHMPVCDHDSSEQKVSGRHRDRPIAPSIHPISE